MIYARPVASTRLQIRTGSHRCVVGFGLELEDAWYLPGNNPASAASGCSRTATSLEKRTFTGLWERPRSAILGSVRRSHVGRERPLSLRISAVLSYESLSRSHKRLRGTNSPGESACLIVDRVRATRTARQPGRQCDRTIGLIARVAGGAVGSSRPWAHRHPLVVPISKDSGVSKCPFQEATGPRELSSSARSLVNYDLQVGLAGRNWSRISVGLFLDGPQQVLVARVGVDHGRLDRCVSGEPLCESNVVRAAVHPCHRRVTSRMKVESSLESGALLPHLECAAQLPSRQPLVTSADEQRCIEREHLLFAGAHVQKFFDLGAHTVRERDLLQGWILTRALVYAQLHVAFASHAFEANVAHVEGYDFVLAQTRRQRQANDHVVAIPVAMFAANAEHLRDFDISHRAHGTVDSSCVARHEQHSLRNSAPYTLGLRRVSSPFERQSEGVRPCSS